MKKLACLLVGIIALLLGAPSSLGQTTNTLFANDDVFVETSIDGLTTTTYDGYVVAGSQAAFGLGAANGTSTGRRRSYLEFGLGTDTAISATFMVYNYWGPNMGGGGNPTVSGTLRLRGSGATPITITEPATSLVTDWVPPAETGFTTIVSSLSVNPGATGNPVGWYSFDITSWYNARLGQTTTLLLRGSFTGYDFPLLEDREGTAFLNGSDNTIAGAFPRIVVVVPEPTSLLLLPLGALVLVAARRR